MKFLRTPPFARSLVVTILPPAAGAVVVDYVTVGNPGNDAGGTGYGDVAYSYRMPEESVSFRWDQDQAPKTSEHPYKPRHPTAISPQIEFELPSRRGCAHRFDKKMKRRHLALLALLLGLTAKVQAVTIVISQPTSTSLADYSPAGFGQSFTANGTYSITAINLYISSSAGGSDITLRLYDFDPLASTLGSVVRGSGILLESSLSSTAAWETITLATPVSVLSGSTYAFTIVAKDPGGSATGWNNYGVNSADVYSGGNRLNIGSGSSVSKQVSDLRFQVVAIPETSSLMLFPVAFAIAAIRRTRRSILPR